MSVRDRWGLTHFFQNNTLVSSDNKGMAAHLYEGEWLSFLERLEHRPDSPCSFGAA